MGTAPGGSVEDVGDVEAPIAGVPPGGSVMTACGQSILLRTWELLPVNSL
jgi:hypothetical protein